LRVAVSFHLTLLALSTFFPAVIGLEALFIDGALLKKVCHDGLVLDAGTLIPPEHDESEFVFDLGGQVFLLAANIWIECGHF
jgi:hypothetical protein